MDKAFDRSNIGYLEKPSSDDLNRAQAQIQRTLMYMLAQVIGGRASDASYFTGPRSGFFPNAFKVSALAPAAMQVAVIPGLGIHYLPADVPTDIGAPDLLGVDDLSPFKPILLESIALFNVPAAPVAVNTRVDIIEVRADRFLADIQTRRQLNPATGNFDPKNYYKTLSYLLDGRTGTVTSPADSTQPLSYKVGVEGNPGVAPSVTAGYIKIAEVKVGTAVATIGNGDIVDTRKLLGANGVLSGTARIRLQWNAGAPIITLRSAALPPDVKLCAIPYPIGGPQRAAMRVFVVCGAPTEVGVTAKICRYANSPSNAQVITEIVGPILLSNDYVQTVDSTIKANMAASTPATDAAVGQTIVAFDVEGRYISGATTDATNAQLEDVEWQIALDIAYH